MSDAPIAYFADDGTAIFRASAIGNCEAALVYSLRGMEPSPPPPDMQARFDDGHLHEPAIIEHLRKAGWVIDQSQDTVKIHVNESIIINGHVDGVGTNEQGVKAVIECKALSDSGYKKWVKEGFGAFGKYAQQATVYMHALNLPLVMAVKNKNSGEVDVQFVEAPPYLLAKLKAKAIRVVRLSGTARTPECPKVKDYPCPFFKLHQDDTGPVDDEDLLPDRLNDLCVDYQSAQARVKDWEETAKGLRAKILEELGQAESGRTGLYEIQKQTVKQMRLNTQKLKQSMNVSQWEEPTEYVKLTVKARMDV